MDTMFLQFHHLFFLFKLFQNSLLVGLSSELLTAEKMTESDLKILLWEISLAWGILKRYQRVNLCRKSTIRVLWGGQGWRCLYNIYLIFTTTYEYLIVSSRKKTSYKNIFEEMYTWLTFSSCLKLV